MGTENKHAFREHQSQLRDKVNGRNAQVPALKTRGNCGSSELGHVQDIHVASDCAPNGSIHAQRNSIPH